MMSVLKSTTPKQQKRLALAVVAALLALAMVNML